MVTPDASITPTKEGVTSFLLRHWPIVLAIFAVTVTNVRADAKTNELERRVVPIEKSIPETGERLASIETQLVIQTKLLDRIDKKLDDQ
jgi:hypothetical protein